MPQGVAVGVGVGVALGLGVGCTRAELVTAVCTGAHRGPGRGPESSRSGRTGAVAMGGGAGSCVIAAPDSSWTTVGITDGAGVRT